MIDWGSIFMLCSVKTHHFALLIVNITSYVFPSSLNWLYFFISLNIFLKDTTCFSFLICIFDCPRRNPWKFKISPSFRLNWKSEIAVDSEYYPKYTIYVMKESKRISDLILDQTLFLTLLYKRQCSITFCQHFPSSTLFASLVKKDTERI